MTPLSNDQNAVTYARAIVACSRLLFLSPATTDPLPRVLDTLLQASRAERVSLFQNSPGDAGELCCSEQLQTVATGVTPEPLAARQMNYQRELPRWQEELARHQTIQGEVASFAATERAVLEARQCVSLLAIPIFIGQEWYGFLAFEDLEQTRYRAPDAVEQLQLIGELIGAYLDKLHAEQRAAWLLADLREEQEIVDTINRIGQVLSAELDLHALVQAATDAATGLTGAQFGAFFYNVVNQRGESYSLYAISGVPREAFSRFPMPRNTDLFGPTFRGEGVIRLADVTQDPRYGKMAPHHGMPEGHLPVRSYLAVPVISRSGEVLGGLFFGHSEPDIFSESAERNVRALVAQIAVAVDNARLHQQAQMEIEERRRTEAALLENQAQMRAFLRDVLASVTEGKLTLCSSQEELPQRLPPLSEPVRLTPDTLRQLRNRCLEAAALLNFPADRASDMLTGVGEAAMNAVVHAGGGMATVGLDPVCEIAQVWIEDQGGGIEISRLPQATLERGFTTGQGFGHGFWLMLRSVSRIWLLTGPSGTTVVLEQSKTPPLPPWLRQQ